MRDLIERITELKRERNAVILAHNYQAAEVQDIADFVGDSLELSLKAIEVDAKVIVFCGVDFMAEQAAVLNPDKVVLIPHAGAHCCLAAMLRRDELLKAKKQHAGVPVVMYVNSFAEVKAEADYVVTSANAAELVKNLDADTVLFGPDAHLADHVSQVTGKTVIPVPSNGHCYVHESIRRTDIERAMAEHPDAIVMAHPECPREVRELAHFVGSTSQMLKFARRSQAKKFIVATEVGLLHRLRKENPDKEFYPAVECAVCIGMKKITLEDIYLALKRMQYVVRVEESIAKRVREAILRTFELLGVEVRPRWRR